MPLYIDQTGGISIAQLSAARARRLKRQRGSSDVLVIDYMQLMTGSARQVVRKPRAGNHRDHHRPEGAGKELNVPIIALSQLSRQVENRDDKRPQLSDLRESGSIEQDADVVLFVYREEYYLGREEPKPNTEEHLQWQERMDQVVGISDVIIGKQRHGPTGTVSLHFDANLTKFTNLVRPGYVPDFRD
jgi:replicative DNA helicase